MNRNELSAALTKLRMTRIAESQGHSPEDAKTIAEDAILRQGGVSGIKAMGTPEGAIVVIVETYLRKVASRGVELGGPEHFTQANNEAIAAIESHRSAFGAKGTSNYPKDIDDYVYYRINLEMQHQFGRSADSMGLDRETVKILTHTAKANLLKTITEGGNSNGSKSCFIATACYGSCDAEIVITLRRYREVVLKKSPIGRHAIYWYYRLSPPIAGFIQTYPKLKQLFRTLLAKLARRLAKKHGL